jgi:MoaA/NifB/PqqE/SkfB family radical SAM enzyme
LKKKKDLYARVGTDDRLELPPSIIAQYGLKRGDRVLLIEEPYSLKMRQPVARLTKIYIEPTNTCNLACRTCIRNIWEEPLGQMSEAVFAGIIDGLRSFSPPPTIMLGGFGEPLHHPDIIAMVQRVKARGCRAELITNGTLLTDGLARELITAGLDMLWVSLDGAKPESYADVRLGAALPEVIANVSRFRDYRHIFHTRIGIVFVAMRRNIADLPEVMILGRKLGADRFLITNLLPYTEDMWPEVLYHDALWADGVQAPSPMAPLVQATRIELSDLTAGPLYRVIRGWKISNFSADSSGAVNYCPFIESGSLAIAWDGSVAPCIPLMHSHTSYLHNRRRFSKRHIVGVVGDRRLKDIWRTPDYRALRDRVQRFDFPPCTHCGGCKLSQTNEEDCIGNSFPTCGGCLWAQGIIRCP